jgi:hypothetical protein
MQKTFVTLAVVALMAAPVLADMGTVTLDLKISLDGVNYYDTIGSGGVSDPYYCEELTCEYPPGPGQIYVGSVHVNLYMTATTTGPDGANYGIQGMFTQILGSCLEGTLTPMTQTKTFTGTWYYGYRCGFGTYNSGGTPDGAGRLIDVGGAQCEPPGMKLIDMPKVGHPDAPHVNGVKPLVASGVFDVNCCAEYPCPTDPDCWYCTIETLGAANLWDAQSGNPPDWVGWTDGTMSVVSAFVIDDVATICCVPEPTTLLLLAPALLVLRRRR